MESGPSGVILLTQIVSQPQLSATSAPLQPLRRFYRGEPLALGITQILTSIIQIAFGIMLLTDDWFQPVVTRVWTPIWTAMLYIISGSLCVEASKNPKMSLVKGMLAMNIVSAVVAGVSIIFYSFSLTFHYAFGRCYTASCGTGSNVPVTLNVWRISPGQATMFGVSMILFAFTILEFCIAISSAAFGCKTVCRDSYSDTSVVIYQNMGHPAALANEPPQTPPPCQTP